MCVQVWMCGCEDMWMSQWMCACVRECISVHLHVCMRMHAYMCKRVWMHASVCACTHTHTHTHCNNKKGTNTKHRATYANRNHTASTLPSAETSLMESPPATAEESRVLIKGSGRGCIRSYTSSRGRCDQAEQEHKYIHTIYAFIRCFRWNQHNGR